MIANLNTFFKNVTKKPFYVFSFLAVPFGLYVFDISNKFKNMIQPKEEEIIDEDELMEEESSEVKDTESDSSYYFEILEEEEPNDEEEKYSWNLFNLHF